MNQIVLINDSNELLTDTVIKSQGLGKNIQIKRARDFEESMEALQDEKSLILSFYVTKNPNDFTHLKLLQKAHELRPCMPLYILENYATVDEETEKYERELVTKLGVRKYFSENITAESLVNSIYPFFKQQNEERIQQISEHFFKDQTEGSNHVVDANGDSFLQVNPVYFFTGTRSLFDLYIKIGTNRFIKIITSGDPVDFIRLDNYLKKGARSFFVKDVSLRSYVDHCKKYLQASLLSSCLSTEDKLDATKSYGNLLGTLINKGFFSEELLSLSLELTHAVRTYLENIDTSGSKLIEDFLKDPKSMSHGVATCMVGSLVAAKAKLGDSETILRIGLACFLHDIGLKSMPEELLQKTEDEMSLKEKTLYRTHTEVGSNEVSTINSIHKSVPRMILHHHIRKESLGFPMGIPFQKLDKNDQVVGLANDLCDKIESMASEDPSKVIKEALASIEANFSSELVEVTQKIFNGESFEE